MKTGAGQRILLLGGVVVLAALAGLAGLLVARFGNARGYPVSNLKQGVNPANLELMTYLLRAHSYEPLCASNGEKGLALAQSTRPADVADQGLRQTAGG